MFYGCHDGWWGDLRYCQDLEDRMFRDPMGCLSSSGEEYVLRLKLGCRPLTYMVLCRDIL